MQCGSCYLSYDRTAVYIYHYKRPQFSQKFAMSAQTVDDSCKPNTSRIIWSYYRRNDAPLRLV